MNCYGIVFIVPGKMTDKKTDCLEILENVSETQELKFVLRLSLRPVRLGIKIQYC